MSAPTIISYGGGVQSTAMVVLAATGRLSELGISVDSAVFANVGDDAERPETLRYVRRTMSEWAAPRQLPIVEIARTYRNGDAFPSLLEHSLSDANRTISIPIRMANGAPGNRSCTARWKIEVISKWLRKHGADKHAPATVLVGISTDEIERAGRRNAIPTEVVRYPLLELGLSRFDCADIIESEGLPVPPKSSCYFCPFQAPTQWAELRTNEPELFERACEIEDELNVKRNRIGRDRVFLTRFGRPLREVVEPAQRQTLESAELCGSGCFT